MSIEPLSSLLSKMDRFFSVFLSKEEPLLYPITCTVARMVENEKKNHHLLWFCLLRDSLSHLCGLFTSSLAFATSVELSIQKKKTNYQLASTYLDTSPLMGQGLSKTSSPLFSELESIACSESEVSLEEKPLASKFFKWISSKLRDILHSKTGHSINRLLFSVTCALVHHNNKNSSLEEILERNSEDPPQWLSSIWQRALDLKLSCFRERSEQKSMEDNCLAVSKRASLLLKFASLPLKTEPEKILETDQSKLVLSFVQNKSLDNELEETIFEIVDARNRQAKIQAEGFNEAERALQTLSTPACLQNFLSNFCVPFYLLGYASHYLDYLLGAGEEEKKCLLEAISSYYSKLVSLVSSNSGSLLNTILSASAIAITDLDLDALLGKTGILKIVCELLSKEVNEAETLNAETEAKGKEEVYGEKEVDETDEEKKERLEKKAIETIRKKDIQLFQEQYRNSTHLTKEVASQLFQLFVIQIAVFANEDQPYRNEVHKLLLAELNSALKNFSSNKSALLQESGSLMTSLQVEDSQICIQQETLFNPSIPNPKIVHNKRNSEGVRSKLVPYIRGAERREEL